MLPAECTGRWDDFIKDLYRANMQDWDCAAEEIALEEKASHPITPEEKLAYREAYAKRQLLRLHDADMKVKNTITLNRSVAGKSTLKNTGWGSED